MPGCLATNKQERPSDYPQSPRAIWRVQRLLVFKDSFSWDETVFEGSGEGALGARAVTILSWWDSEGSVSFLSGDDLHHAEGQGRGSNRSSQFPPDQNKLFWGLW